MLQQPPKTVTVLLRDEKMYVHLSHALFDTNDPCDSWWKDSHSHSLYEIHVLLKGSAQVRVHEQLYVIHPGSAIIIAPGQYHEAWSVEGDFARFSFLFSPEEKDGALARLLKQKIPAHVIFPISDEIRDLSTWILQDRKNYTSYSLEMQEVLFKAFMISLFRILRLEVHPDAPNAPSLPRRLICDNYFADPSGEKSAQELASQLAVSQRQLHRYLLDYYGMNFQQKLNQARMERAGWLLRTTDRHISDIAQQVGYDSESGFFKVFQKFYETTPTQYRVKNQVKLSSPVIFTKGGIPKMRKLKVGIVGVRRGGAYLRDYHRSDRTEVTAICDLDPQKLADAAEEMNLTDSQCFQDYDAFLNADTDIVIIGTPIPFHEEQVVKALEAGKHVLSEVTMAHTVAGCRRIYEAAKTAKGKYMLGENYQYFHFIKEWKKYVDAGYLGNIHYAEAEYIHDIRNLLIDKESGESFWRTYRPPIHYCTHCLGPLLYLLGDDYIVKATAIGDKNTILPELWPSTIDMQVALFETKQGRGIKICRSQVMPLPEPHTVYYSLYGTKGFIENARHHHDGVGRRYFEGIDHREVPINCYMNEVEAPNFAKNSHGTSDYYIAHDFLDCIEFDREPILNAQRAMEVTLPGLIAHEAAVQGGVWLDVPHFD